MSDIVGGDSDTTATIACAWWGKKPFYFSLMEGAIHGFQGVPPINYKNVEYKSRMETVAQQLLFLSGLA